MFILDRFEGDFAVLINEDGQSKILPRSSLKDDAREGDVFVLLEDGSFAFDKGLTKSRKESVKSRFSRLVKRKNNP